MTTRSQALRELGGRLTLVTACDPRFTEAVVALLGSLRLCEADIERLELIVFADGLTPRERTRVQSAADTLGLALTLMDFEVPETKTTTRFAMPAAYARLLIPRLVDAAVVLYVDADVVFLRCPTQILASLSTERVALYAVPDLYGPDIRSRAIASRVPSADLDLPYFNSGVLLMRPGAWRRHGWDAQALQLAVEGDLVLPDQDALNLVFRRRWRQLDQRWNVYPMTELLQLDSGPYPGERLVPRRRLEALETSAHLMHFATEFKPWRPEFPPGANRDRWARAHAAGQVLAGS